MAPAPSRPRNRDAFKLAVLCALSLEAGMVESVFDEFWDDSNAYGKAPGDENAYTLGVVGNHNVVLAHMPGMGSNNAAIAAASLRSSFREIEVIFVVGICGVAPINIQTKEEIVLGDCIISTGVVQYDFGRQYPNGFVEKDGIQDSLGRASNEIRAWLSKLTTPRTRARLTNHLAQHLQLLQKTRPDARYPGWQRDRLYQPSYLHRHQNENVCNACLRDVGVCKKDCELIGCDDDKLIKRNKFQALQISLDEIQYNSPNLHFGKFGSANTVMKSGSHRDFIAEKNELIAFEMEGAGVWEIFRTVIVKSACDYADSHKSKEWQPYAAATAAAGLKALLETWDVADQPLETVHQMLAQTRNDNNTRARGELHLKDVASLNKEDRECLAKLHLTTPALDKERIEKRAGGLFRDCYTWILDHNAFKKWREGYENLLWIKGDPGKGKTMLLCGIIDELVDTPLVSYFFCQATYDETNNSATAILRGLLWMLVDQNPRLIQYIKNEADRSSESIYSNANSFFNLSKILQNLLQDIGTAIFIVDALDECIDGRNDLIDLIRKTQTRIKWLISSRNWPVIEERLRDTPKVSMEIEDSVGIAVQSYIKLKVSRLATLKMYSQDLKTFILEYLSKHAQGTFLWCALVCTSLENVSKREVRRIINELPPTLDALYRRMLESVTTKSYALTLSRILATATCVYRPVSTLEMGNVIDLSEDDMDSMEELVEECGSFLTIRDGIVEFVHLSAQEYVKKYLPLAIEAKSTHQELYHCSLRAMSRTLKRNVCELGDVCIHISEVVLPVTNPLVPITYCCSFWARHLEESGTIAFELLDNSPLSKFFYNNLLFWLEAIGFLKIASNAVLAMHILYSITKVLYCSSFRNQLITIGFRHMPTSKLYFRRTSFRSPLSKSLRRISLTNLRLWFTF